MAHGRKIAVIGLGYVGLPVAVVVRALRRAGDRASTSTPVGSTNCAPATTAPARSSRAALTHAGRCRFDERSGSAQGARLFHRHGADADRRRQPAGSARAASAHPKRSARRSKRGAIVVYEFDGLSRLHRGRLRAGAGARVGPERGKRFHGRLFARAHQSRRQEAPLRDHHQGGCGAGREDARHRRRCLWLGGDGRHSSRAVDQGRGSREGDREHAARSQHRLHERTVRDLPSARHRHRRRARRRRHQVEFPEILSGSGRRPLHRRRSLLPDATAPRRPAIIPR